MKSFLASWSPDDHSRSAPSFRTWRAATASCTTESTALFAAYDYIVNHGGECVVEIYWTRRQ